MTRPDRRRRVRMAYFNRGRKLSPRLQEKSFDDFGKATGCAYVEDGKSVWVEVPSSWRIRGCRVYYLVYTRGTSGAVDRVSRKLPHQTTIYSYGGDAWIYAVVARRARAEALCARLNVLNPDGVVGLVKVSR